MGYRWVGLCFEFIAIIIPLFGIYSILKIQQTKSSSYLLLANVGAFIMNICTLFIMNSKDANVSLQFFRLDYFGNIFFFLFFFYFLFHYLKLRMKTLCIGSFLAYEIIDMILVLSDKHKDMTFGGIQIEESALLELNHITMTDFGVVTTIRYCIIAVTLSFTIILCIYRCVKSNTSFEKHNYVNLITAQLIIAGAVITSNFMTLVLDVVPIASSSAILLIVLSVLNGDFFMINELGRDVSFDNISSCLVIIDNQFRFVDANKTAIDKFSCVSNFCKGKELNEEMKFYFMSENDEFEIENHYFKKRTTPLYNKNELTGYCVIVDEITDTKKLLDDLVEATNKAEDANKAKSVFMSNMSHEIRTPMNAIIGLSEVLLRMDLGTEERQYVENICSSGEALISIINDVLDISKIEAGKIEIIEDEYEPASLLNDLSLMFLNRIGNKPIELIYDIDNSLPQKLYGDVVRTRQVITNIVNNAIKYTEKGFVKFSLHCEELNDGEIVLDCFVQDSGIGIREEDRNKLFESFSQVDTKRNRNIEGTGLGLAIAKQLIELMGGQISFDSVYGEGTTFYFTIKQRRVSQNPAVALKSTVNVEDTYISGIFKNEYEKSNLQRLCEELGFKYIEYNHISDHLNFLFTDEDTYVSMGNEIDEFKSLAEIIVIRNPMNEHRLWNEDFKVMNAPLYSINFIHIINHDKQTTVNRQNNLITFIAPKAKILIVDDNQMNLKVAKKLLEPFKMKIDTAESGKEALRKLDNKQYDLIFMDHMMPEMDGIECTDIIRSRQDSYAQNVPIIALSANEFNNVKNEFLAHGMNDFVSKPIEFKHLVTVLKKWLPEVLRVDASIEIVESKVESEIEGIDVKSGIANSGGEDLFYSLLGDFYVLIDSKTKKIKEYFADNLIKNVEIEVHALKNTARMIGALDLANQFFELEKHAHDSDLDYLEEHLNETLEFMNSYKPILAPYAKINMSEKSEISNDELVEVLLLMKDSADIFDLDEVDECLKKLDSVRLSDNLITLLDELRIAVADVDNATIIEVIEKMIHNM